MDKEKIISYLTSGSIPGGGEYKMPLQDIVHTFPYFQLAQVLYAKQLYDDNDTDVATRVKLASVYAPNRKAMYLLFRKQAEKKTDVKVAVETKVEKKVAEEPKYNFVFQSAEPPVAKEEPKAESFVVTLPQVQPEAEKKEIKEETTASPVSETFLEKEILSNIAAIQIEQHIADIPVSEEIKEAEKLAEVPVKTVEPEVVADLSGAHSFKDWLKILPTVKHADKETITTKPPAKSGDIIERFLANEPRISKPKAEFFSPAKAAKMSINEDESIVSETLAKIYLSQGNLHKALKAYESLLLQNPEKSTYFAARIKEIRDKIESQKNK